MSPGMTGKTSTPFQHWRMIGHHRHTSRLLLTFGKMDTRWSPAARRIYNAHLKKQGQPLIPDDDDNEYLRLHY